MISMTAVDGLMQLGQRRGGVGIDDLQQALPVDSMTIEELADVLTQLEEAGISVEIEPALLAPRHRKMTPHDVASATEPSRHNERATTDQGRLSALASSIKAARQNSYRARRPAITTSVKMPGTIFVVAAALVLFLLVLAVWRFG